RWRRTVCEGTVLDGPELPGTVLAGTAFAEGTVPFWGTGGISVLGTAGERRGLAVEPFDTSRPNIARVWDYWLGGKENFAADRELAEKMLAVHPVTAQMARESRQFRGRAVIYRA